MKYRVLTLLLSAFVLTASAQSLDAAFFEANPDAAGGIYYTYRFTPTVETDVPNGNKPF